MNSLFLKRALALWAGLLSLTSLAHQIPLAQSQSRLYGVTFFSQELISINTTDGSATRVGQLTNVSGYGIAARYGRLYSFDASTNRLVEIDPATGNISRLIDIGVSGLQGEGDIAIRNDGVGILVSALNSAGAPVNDVYSFDIIGGTSTRLASSTFSVDAIAFGSNNVLYALGQGGGKLYTLNITNGALTEVGSLGIEMNSPFAGLTAGPNGELYAAVDDRLFLVNPATGAAQAVSTNVLNFDFSSVSGLAFQMPQTNRRLVGLSFFGNELFSVNNTTGDGMLIGPLVTASSGYGLATSGEKLYTFDPNTNRLVEINPTTGQGSRFINIGVPKLSGEGDLAFRGDGVGFLASALATNGTPVNDLYRFDPVAGTSTRIGSSAFTLDALAFGTNNVLYALAQGGGKLYTINQTNATAIEVGPLGIQMNSPFAGMTFAPDGTLYIAADDRLYTVNPATGAATAVDTNIIDFGFSSVSGLAFAPSPSRLTMAREGNNVVLYWSGPGFVLESATIVTGPYTAFGNQGNPQRVTMAGSMRYFRLKRL